MTDRTDTTNGYRVDEQPGAVPDFDDAPGTHGELLHLPLRQREELSEVARDLLGRIA